MEVLLYTVFLVCLVFVSLLFQCLRHTLDTLLVMVHIRLTMLGLCAFFSHGIQWINQFFFIFIVLVFFIVFILVVVTFFISTFLVIAFGIF